MHIEYNHRIKGYNANSFDPDGRTKTLIIGNSQARDFANILIETGVMEDAQLIYRANLPICEYENLSETDVALVQQADIIFFPIVTTSAHCKKLLDSGQVKADNIFFVGPKHFGYNLNAFTRLDKKDRPQYTVRIFDDFAQANIENTSVIPAERYIDLINYASEDGLHVRVFDKGGDIISADRVHITQAGARFFAAQFKNHPALEIFR